MAEVDIVADAHQANVVLPNIARIPASAPINTSPHMGVEPMQLSMLRKNNGQQKKFHAKKGPRQGRNSGPPSSNSTQNLSRVACFNCGKLGHYANTCRSPRKVRVSMMLHSGLIPSTEDDDAVTDLKFEGAVHPVQQTEVPSNLHASSSRCKQLHGMCHPIRAMAVTRQNTRTTFGDSRRGATELNASCDERIAHHGSTRACNPSCTEQEEVVESPGGPPTVRTSLEGIRTNETSPASQGQQTLTVVGNHWTSQTIYASNVL